MGKRVYVVKQSAKYGSEGFNWKGQDFKDFLDAMGCNTSGEDYADKFDCEVSLYEKSLNILKEYQKNYLSDSVKQYLSDVDYSIDDFEDDLIGLGGIDEVLSTMQSFYDTREKDVDYIYFEVW